MKAIGIEKVKNMALIIWIVENSIFINDPGSGEEIIHDIMEENGNGYFFRSDGNLSDAIMQQSADGDNELEMKSEKCNTVNGILNWSEITQKINFL